MNTYRVTFKDFKPVYKEAFSREEAIRLTRETLNAWGYMNLGKAKVEVIK